MFYRCKKCNRFLAAVKDSKNFTLVGKKVTAENGEIYIECIKCGTVQKIVLEKNT